MYLKRLETIGFKSFAERIDLEFMPGMTAVVGPNGSGKSNITEAVRWVLGEQSAKSLRGSKMEDVIFQGSASRRPLNMAEVTLVLDNESNSLPLDYAEVSITRRVYRSGESEFYINGKSVRLKDIIELFLDSGLGREAFSMISQGRVEEILSSKAEQRRTIFEEAAGVLKYKQRKQKAEYKLSETAMNLERVRDITGELEQQIGPLAKQAETAAHYNKLKTEREKEEISLLLAEIEQLHAEWQTLLKSLDEGKLREHQWRKSIDEQETANEKSRLALAKLDEQVEQYQAELIRLTEKIEQAAGKRQVLLERSKHAASNREKTKQEKEIAKGQVAAIDKSIAACEKAIEETEALKGQLLEQAQRTSLQLADTKKDNKAEMEHLKSEYIELLNRQAAMNNEKKVLADQLGRIAERADTESRESSELEEGLRLSEEKLSSALSAKKNLDAKAAMGKQRLLELQASLSAAQNGLQTLRNDEHTTYQHVTKLRSRKEMLETMQSDMQGFHFGTKEVLQAAESGVLKGVIGAVVQLIEIPDEMTDAIETALGGAAQHLIAEDERSAREGIAWLKKQKKGRATFLPLATIEPRRIPELLLRDLEKQPGHIGIASELIAYDKAHAPAIRHLLGNVLVARNLRDANEIAAIAHRRYRIVTLEGDIVNPGGSMTGGAKRNTGTSIFTRKKELQQIGDRLTEEENKLHRTKTNHAAVAKKREQLENEYEIAGEELKAAEQELANAEHAYRTLELEHEAMMRQLEAEQQGKTAFRQEEDELKSRLKENASQLGVLQQQIKLMDLKLKELIEHDETLSARQNELTTKLHEEQLNLAKTEERLEALRNRCKLHEEQKESIEAKLGELEQELVLTSDAQTVGFLRELDRVAESAAAEKSELLKTVQTAREQRHQQTRQLKDAEKELKGENRLFQTFLKNRQEQEVQAARLDVALDTKLQALQEEYAVTYEKASSMHEKSEDIEKSKERLLSLNGQIDRLGTVNIGAIEEYERVSERLRFLTEQETDLITAKETLTDAISELDEEMERRFAETFTDIQNEFSQVFAELFGGGHAALSLTDPGNLLETGIDIVAEPPGKKLKALSLLSGGERALTAIALLFSILRVRPVPFCILDEVEAALDEANVVRFAKYLHAHGSRTQFIVITHRKGTMEEADALYGVTMEESGVSRIVSVRLSDAETLVQS